MMIPDQKKFLDEVTYVATSQIEVNLNLDTSAFDKGNQNRFLCEEKLRKELCKTKSCFITLFNEEPYNEYLEEEMLQERQRTLSPPVRNPNTPVKKSKKKKKKKVD